MIYSRLKKVLRNSSGYHLSSCSWILIVILIVWTKQLINSFMYLEWRVTYMWYFMTYMHRNMNFLTIKWYARLIDWQLLIWLTVDWRLLVLLRHVDAAHRHEHQLEVSTHLVFQEIVQCRLVFPHENTLDFC